jgi:hypothetical protein
MNGLAPGETPKQWSAAASAMADTQPGPGGATHVDTAQRNGSTVDMPALRALTPSEAQRALAVAAEWQEQHRERQAFAAAAAEVGVKEEYLERAAAAVIAERRSHGRRFSRRHWGLCGVLAAAAVALAATVPHILTPAASIHGADQTIAASATAPVVEGRLIAATPDLLAHARSLNHQYATSITFVNRRATPVALYWIDYNGGRDLYTKIAPGETITQPTYRTHPWLLTDDDQKIIGMVYASRDPARVTIDR